MTYNDLKKFSDAVDTYMNRLGNAVLPCYHNVNEDGINEIVPLLHRATDEFKIEELRAMLNDEWERTDRTELIGDYENVVYIVNQLLQLIKGYPDDLEEYDSDVDDLGVKVQTISHEMDEQLQNLRNRAETEPTQADKDSLKKLSKYVRISGIYKTFEEFLDLVIFKNVTDEIPMRRRANYLLKECCGDSGLKHYYDGIQNYVDAKLNPAPAPAPIKVMAGDASTPDSSNMENLEPTIDANRLESYFTAKFKGAGNNPNYFETLVSDTKKINVTKELAMIAVMIYDCNNYFIKKPSTFASWLREFFDIIGRDCPKDTHKNKYQASETIRKMFYYLE